MTTLLNETLLNECLKAAKRAAFEAEKIIHKYYKKSPITTIKNDLTPVTQADLESEQVIKNILSNSFPEFGFYGEETGKTDTDSDFTWLVDPIDGTKSFVRNYGFFSTQIALMYNNKIVLGVSNAPIFQEMCWATKGMGAYLNDKKINVSKFSAKQDLCFSTGNITSLIQSSELWKKLQRTLALCSKTRGYGDFYHYHLLASGKLDLVIESDINILDIAALTIIVQEAGGTFTELNGGPIDLNTTSVLAGNSSIHTQALEIFNS